MLVENVYYTTCVAGFQRAKGEVMAGDGEVYTWTTFGHFLNPGEGNISKEGRLGISQHKEVKGKQRNGLGAH